MRILSRTRVASALSLGALVACAAYSKEPASELSPAELSAAHSAFDVVYDVLQHPRCLNCHPTGDRPLQFDTHTPHAMNVVRGDDDRGVAGMRCESCHGKSNPTSPHLPPGVSTGWRLAPKSMAFEGLSPNELARMLADEDRAHLSLDELVEHVAHDPLVQWGWNPGPGREPVPVAHDEFVTAFRTWIEAGAPAPPKE